MTTLGKSEFIAGVIEGFYGEPWTRAQRLELLRWMSAWGLNTYLYAPKDDLKHRSAWRELYTLDEASDMAELVRNCDQAGVRFIYALAPGLDIQYSAQADLDSLRSRLDQMMGLGCRAFTLSFDDIPDRMAPADLERWGSLAAAQAGVVNELYRWARERHPETIFMVCPTPYCGRMASRHLGGEDYLEVIGRELEPGIDVFWTGPEIISREITVEHARQVAAVLRRKPLIWDNLHANDYDGRRFFCGPYAGRPPELKSEVRGLLVNPNNEFWLNYVPFRTLGSFVTLGGPWNEREAYLEAMRTWLESLTSPGFEIAFHDWIRLGDCFYLPYEDGPVARELMERARRLLSSDPQGWGSDADHFMRDSARLRELCGRLASLRQRAVFHAMSRRLWDLREELDVMEKFVAFKRQPENSSRPFGSDYHLPGTFRGGFLARWQRLLELKPDGTFTPVAHE